MKNKTQCPHCGSIFTIETNETFDYITKFKIGQEVFYLSDGGIVRNGEILSIKLWDYKTMPLIYEIEYSGNIQGEEFVFATREEAEKRLAELKGIDK